MPTVIRPLSFKLSLVFVFLNLEANQKCDSKRDLECRKHPAPGEPPRIEPAHAFLIS